MDACLAGFAADVRAATAAAAVLPEAHSAASEADRTDVVEPGASRRRQGRHQGHQAARGSPSAEVAGRLDGAARPCQTDGDGARRDESASRALRMFPARLAL